MPSPRIKDNHITRLGRNFVTRHFSEADTNQLIRCFDRFFQFFCKLIRVMVTAGDNMLQELIDALHQYTGADLDRQDDVTLIGLLRR